MEMYYKVVILALSFLTLSAYPIHRKTRDVSWTDPKANQAYDKTELTKDEDIIYKSHIDSSSLYNQEDQSKNPIAEEMQQKLNMESERLRARLRQELAELRERLSPSPAHLGATLASMRERLAPLTQQLQSSLSSNTQDLCGQLSLYLQGLETAETAQAAEASQAVYQEVSQQVSQALEHSSSKVADIISDFQAKTTEVSEHLKEEKSELWQEMSSKLGEEVSLLRREAQSRVAVLKSELSAQLEMVNPLRSEVASSLELFCQNAALQGQVFQARMEKLFQELEEELEVHRAPSLSSSSSISLQEDFSVKLSALIQDILHSV
ncbi:apolipoprotein A-I [Cheilinus undulatus]|uniref:apolipoprotein A-I n=1 Tax=Cheilinus undulatus TaxID=241271 RepID=UPI001BD605BD|nr:apolipoprotein A-I [Cheilinus undulatus]